MGSESKTAAQALDRIADGLFEVARALRWLGNGDAFTEMGAIEALGVAVRESTEGMEESLGNAIKDMGANIKDGLLRVAEAHEEGL